MIYWALLASLFEALGLREKSFFDRLTERVQGILKGAADSLERTTEQARERAGEAAVATRRKREQVRGVRDRARELAGERRNAIGERVESLTRRAAELRERRAERLGQKQARRHRRRALRRRRPLHLDVRRDDRVVLRGRRPIDLRTSDGAVIRYRFYERPGLARRLYWGLTGRRVWPR